jgi:hypothetical protein
LRIALEAAELRATAVSAALAVSGDWTFVRCSHGAPEGSEGAQTGRVVHAERLRIRHGRPICGLGRSSPDATASVIERASWLATRQRLRVSWTFVQLAVC